MGLKNFANVLKACTRAGSPGELLKLLVEVAPQLRAIAVAFAPALAPAVIAPAPAPAPTLARPAAAPATAEVVTTPKREPKLTEKGKEWAEARRKAEADENVGVARATSNELPGACPSIAPLGGAEPVVQLPLETPKSLFFDGWGTFFSTLIDVMAAELAGEVGKARKGCVDVLGRCEDLLERLPPMDVVKFLFAAPLAGEHASAKVRHDKDVLTPDKAELRFRGAVSLLQEGPRKVKSKGGPQGTGGGAQEGFPRSST
jgi:hypothetical protein